jgi:hypothetical protein
MIASRRRKRCAHSSRVPARSARTSHGERSEHRCECLDLVLLDRLGVFDGEAEVPEDLHRHRPKDADPTGQKDVEGTDRKIESDDSLPTEKLVRELAAEGCFIGNSSRLVSTALVAWRSDGDQGNRDLTDAPRQLVRWEQLRGDLASPTLCACQEPR